MIPGIFGLSGTSLRESERAFLRFYDPVGVILFARNVETPDQVRALTADIRDTLDRNDAPVLIDQEGGRVRRLRPPHWPDLPAAEKLHRGRDRQTANRAVFLHARLIAAELHQLGINVNCAPVLDIPAPGSHDIVGDRAYGDNAADVTRNGRAVMDGLLAGGVLPVIKHLPGHGRAMADSHLELPVVDADPATLAETDFAPFDALNDAPFAMTAHIVYSAIDKINCATQSVEIIGNIIRSQMRFDGFLMSDDVDMKALTGTPGHKAWTAINAGCDGVLQCSGDKAVMDEVAEALPEISPAARNRLGRALSRRTEPAPFDLTEGYEELDHLLQGGAGA